MSNFTDIFIRRPVLALVLCAVMLLLGLQAASQLTLREYFKCTPTNKTQLKYWVQEI